MSGDGEIQNIRMRTAKGTEFIITSHEEFIMCCVQDCSGAKVVTTTEVVKKEEED